MNDKVLFVYPCSDDVGIQMQNAGWVVARQIDVGQKRVDRIMAVALTLLATGNKTGFFDDNNNLANWCGMTNIKTISALGITNTKY